MTTDEQRGRVIADLLAGTSCVGLKPPNTIRDDVDCIRLVFKHVADLRRWADHFGINTVGGVRVRALTSSRPVLRLVAS